jgi:hypothetical protein
MPMVRKAFRLGFRQLGLSIGPALLATVPVLFIVAWVAVTFVFTPPAPSDAVAVSAEPDPNGLRWSENAKATTNGDGWTIYWPDDGESLSLIRNGDPLLRLSSEDLNSLIHKRRWWNWLLANPAGYLPDDLSTDMVRVDLPQRQYLGFGPSWMRGWAFLFFGTFLATSLAFKLVLKID